MTWFIWILISIAMTAGSNLLQRVIMGKKDSDPFSTMLIFQTLTTLMTGLFAVSRGFVLPEWGAPYAWNIMLSGLFWGVGSFAMFKAYQLLGASENAIISSFSAIVTIGTAMYFLSETLDVYKSLGIVLILISVLVISVKKGKLSFTKGTIYALLSTTCYGLGVTSDAFILRSYDAISYTPIAFLLPGVFLVALKPSVLGSFRRLKDLIFTKNIIFLSFFYAAQGVTYYLALQSGGNASQIAPIFKANIVLTVFLAVIFLKEKEKLWLKFLSAVLVTVGVLLIK